MRKRLRYDLIVFDCDGVMFDTLKANEVYYNHLRAHFDLPPISREELVYVQWASVSDSIHRIMPDSETEARTHEYRAQLRYEQFFQYMVMAPDLEDVLTFLRTIVRTGVVTNREDSINPLLEYYKLSSYFDVVVSALDVSRPKPHPDSLLLALEKLAVAPDRALYIGDAESDALAARSAGVDIALFKNRDVSADYYIDTLSEIKKLINSQD